MELGPFEPLLAALLGIVFLTSAAEAGLIWLRSIGLTDPESSGHDS